MKKAVVFILFAFVLVEAPSCTQEGLSRRYAEKSRKFLEKNMVVAYSATGPSLDEFYSKMEIFYSRPDVDMWSQYAYEDSIFAVGNFFGDIVRVYDRDSLPEGYMQRRIDDAMMKWRTSPFAKDLRFKDFCEFLLPYRVGNETLEEWWTLYREYFGEKLDSICSKPGVTVADFCDEFNKFFPEMDRSYTGYPAGKPSFKPSYLVNILGGTCDDYMALFTYAARTYGIPVATDFTPQWGNHSQGHSWCAVIQGDSTYHYMVSEPLFLAREKPFTWKLVKAYRRTVTPQHSSLAFQTKASNLPPAFRDPRMVDVSRAYMDVAKLHLEGLWQDGRSSYVFLTCFNDEDWTAVAGAKRHGGKAVFENVGFPAVFLPQYYRDGSFTPALWPVKVDSSRRIIELIPDTEKLGKVTLTRKFLDVRAKKFAGFMKGGRFELSTEPDFSRPYIIEVPDSVGFNFQTAEIPTGNKYRYVRYLPPKGGTGDIAEIEVYSKGADDKLAGRVIGTYRSKDKFHPMENVFDGQTLTYATCGKKQEESPWVGIDLGQLVEVEKICYLPRNDDNFIREGEDYELFYWNGGGWTSLGRKEGSRATQELVFDNVPSNALLLLHDHTKGKEERIFTYENGGQMWW